MTKHNNHRKCSPYEIFRVMTTMLSRDVPFESNLKDVAAYCQTVNNKINGTFTTVMNSEGVVDLPNFLESLSESCLIIYYSGQRCDNDTVDLMHKLDKFLQAYGLNKKNLIVFSKKISIKHLALSEEFFIDFPTNSDEFLKCKAAGFSPNNVIEIVPKVCHVLRNEPENFGNKKKLNVGSYSDNNITRLPLSNNVEDDCKRLKNAIDQCTYTSSLNHDSGFHLQRIILLGQIGSGRKTQSRLLAKRWHLIFLDFRVLLLDYAKLNKSFDDLLIKVRNVRQINRKLMASILFERITKRDCLENGWILVGYVSSVADFEIMEKEFFIIPNKIVFIHCRQHLCLDRLRTRVIKNAEINECRYSNTDERYAKLGFLDLYSPCCAINHIVTEIDHFCRNRRAILKYCQDRAKYIAHIDGEHSVSTVTTMLWGQLDKFKF